MPSSLSIAHGRSCNQPAASRLYYLLWARQNHVGRTLGLLLTDFYFHRPSSSDRVSTLASGITETRKKPRSGCLTRYDRTTTAFSRETYRAPPAICGALEHSTIDKTVDNHFLCIDGLHSTRTYPRQEGCMSEFPETEDITTQIRRHSGIETGRNYWFMRVSHADHKMASSRTMGQFANSTAWRRDFAPCATERGGKVSIYSWIG